MKPIPSSVHVTDLVGKDVVLRFGAIVRYGHEPSELLLPAGTAMRADGVGRALSLVTPRCPACGVAVRLNAVPRRHLGLPDGTETEYPVRAYWRTAPDGKACACTRCGFASSRGGNPERNALDAGGAMRWRFCPGCGAGMSTGMPEDERRVDGE